MFLVFTPFLIGYFFSFRFDCQVTLDAKYLEFAYFIPFRKSIRINTDQIVEVDKHQDFIKRYHKKLLINTFEKSYLIRYNISDDSDEEFLKTLQKIVGK
jgi:hypothetical protein